MNDDRRHDELPTAASQHEGVAAGDETMEDDLTQERYPTPQERSDAADATTMDP